MLLQNQGKYDEAEPLYREALKAMRETLATATRIPSVSINILGTLRSGQVRRGGAAVFARRCRFRETRGDRHPNTLTSINNLGGLLQNQGKSTRRSRCCARRWKVRRETHGDRHPIPSCRSTTSARCCRIRASTTRRSRYREALQVRRETLGDRHPNTLISIGNLADLLRERGQLDAASAELGDAVAVATEVVGADHRTTLKLTGQAARLTLAQMSRSARRSGGWRRCSGRGMH